MTAHTPQLTNCAKCGRATRPNRKRIEDFPGIITIAYGCTGHCATCYKKAKKTGERLVEPRPTMDPVAEERNIAYIRRGLEAWHRHHRGARRIAA